MPPDRLHTALRRVLAANALMALAPAVAFAQETANPTEVSAIEVIGYADQEAEAINQKRRYESIGEFLASDDLGQNPDYNIADAMRSLPGVQVEEDRGEGTFVQIRGLPSAYAVGSYDGGTLATAWRETRALNVEMIPTSMIAETEVLMARTPDLEGNAIGGTFNLKTRSAFDRGGRRYLVGNALVGYSDQTTVPRQAFGPSHRDDVDFRLDGTGSMTFGENRNWGVLVGASWSRRSRDQLRVTPGTGSANNLSGSYFEEPGPAPVNSQYYYYAYGSMAERTGLFGKLEYRSTDRSFRSGVQAAHYEMFNDEIRYGQQLRITGTGTIVDVYTFPIKKPQDILRADFDWSFAGNQTLSGQISRSRAEFNQVTETVNFRIPNTNATTAPRFDVILDGDGVPTLSNVDPAFTDPSRYTSLNQYAPYSDIQTNHVTEARLDWAVNRDAPGWGFQAGVKLRRSEYDRERERTSYTYRSGSPAVSLADFVLDETSPVLNSDFRQLLIDVGSFVDYFNANQNSFALHPVNTLTYSIGGDWGLTEDVSAAYGLVEYQGARQQIIFGGRFEKTDTDIWGWSYTGNGGLESQYTRFERNGASYSDFLPSVTYRLDVAQGVTLRLAYFDAVGRPQTGDLANGETVAEGDPDNDVPGTITRGNPDLKPRRGTSFDAALEWYLPDDMGLLSLGAFHKDIKDDIFTLVTQHEIDGQVWKVREPINAASAEITGYSINFSRSKLDFLPGFLADLGVSANANWLDPSTAFVTEDGVARDLDFMQGMADFNWNAALFYEHSGFRARLSWAHMGKVHTAVGATEAADLFRKPYDLANLQVRYRLNPRVEVVGEARDLLADDRLDYREYQSNGDTYASATGVGYFGRQFWLGVSARF